MTGSSFYYLGWSEDMDATTEQSLFIIASRAGMQPDEIDRICEELEEIAPDSLDLNQL